jgi:beta-glucosidase
LAHGLACQAIRAASPQPCTVALVDNPSVTVPLTESPADIAAAQKAFHTSWRNGGIIFPALTGQYSPIYLEQLGKDAPNMQPGDLEIIHQPLDWLGLNIYCSVKLQKTTGWPGFLTTAKLYCTQTNFVIWWKREGW